ncbi:MAG: ATP-binding protein, partial [Phycisphaerae bacterium]|nr:ATP-binding protein [Phycisphaerae bacterium]
MASIQVIQGSDKGRTFNLYDGENFIGRDCHPVGLSDGTASRVHACLNYDGGKWVLIDSGSANGTILNGVRIAHPVMLKRGDQIRCGSTLLVFQGDSAPATGRPGVDIDEEGMLVDAAIVATVNSNEDSVIIPTPEAGAQAIDNLRILYNFIVEASSILNIDELLQHTLDKVFELLKADRSFIMLVDEEGILTLKCSRQVDEAGEAGPPVSRTIINEVINQKVGVLSSNAMGDKRFASGKSVHNLGIRSAICVPIMGRDRVLGVIYVDCALSEQTYSTEQLRLLTAIGYQTGLAIENVQLYESAIQSERLAAIGETVAFLSHHIKNIQQALGAGIDVVEMGINSGNLGKARDAWPIVQRNVGRINRLILNMLAFSKDREPLLENVDVNAMLRDCMELTTPAADERGIALLSDLQDLPEILADAAGLRQGLLNLMTNALDAAADQSGVITVRSRYDTMNRSIQVQVIDNGGGIEPDQLDDIFTPFFSSKGQKGTGLGLAVAKKVVEEHQGRIVVASRPGKGATFT